MEIAPLLLTFKLATATTIVLFFIAIPVSYWLVSTKSKLKPIIEATISLPLVLPPTVLGFYFLLLLSPNSYIGSWILNTFHIQFVFSFWGLLLASLLYSLPFMIHPIQAGLSSLPKSYTETAILMGKSKSTIISRILLPNIKPALLTGIVLSFAHTVGEFGVVLMIGGNIPGKTKVASIAIYDEVESLNYTAANQYSFILLALSFFILISVYITNGGYLKKLIK